MKRSLDRFFRRRLEALFQQDETQGPWRRRLRLRLGKLFYLTFRKINQSLCLERAATLSFTATITMIPLAILLVFVFDTFGSFESARAEFRGFLEKYVADDLRSQALAWVTQVESELQGTRTAIQGVAFVVLVFSALALYRSAERTFSVIWNVQIKRGFFQKLGTFWLILTAAPLILSGSLYLRESLTARLDQLGGVDNPSATTAVQPAEPGRSWAELEQALWNPDSDRARESGSASGTETGNRAAATGSVSGGDGGGGGFLGWFRRFVVNWLFPISTSFFAFTIVYVYLPNARVKLNTAATTALVAACCWQLTTWGFTHYVQLAPGLKVYGVLGIIPSFLIWMYLSWVIVLGGAALSYCLQNYAVLEREVRFHIQKERISRPVQALLFLERIYRGFGGSAPSVNVDDLATEFSVPLSEADAMLGILSDSGFVVVDPRGVVTPRRSADRVRAFEVVEAFPHGTGYRLPPGVEPGGNRLVEMLSGVARSVEEQLSRQTLADLLEKVRSVADSQEDAPEPTADPASEPPSRVRP